VGEGSERTSAAFVVTMSSSAWNKLLNGGGRRGGGRSAATTADGVAAAFPRFTVRQLRRLLDANDDDANVGVSSEQLCSYCYSLAQAGERVWKLNAFAALVKEDEWLEDARRSDDMRRRRRNRRQISTSNGNDENNVFSSSSALDGIPVSIKANIAVRTLPLTAGSRVLGAGMSLSSSSAAVVGYDASVVESLLLRRSASGSGGAVLLGTTNMDEFGMGSLGTNVVVRGNDEDGTTSTTTTATKNPLPFLLNATTTTTTGGGGSGGVLRRLLLSDEDAAYFLNHVTPDAVLEAHGDVVVGDGDNDTDNSINNNNNSNSGIAQHYSAGGSTCGGACSVSHGSSIVSIGSDTGGSVRLPSAWCGVAGLKPTYGLLPRRGLVAYASSLDAIGMLAPTADCLSLALQDVLESQSRRQVGRVPDSTQVRDPTNLLAALRRTTSKCTGYGGSSGDKNQSESSPTSSSPLNDLKVGIPEAFSVSECSPELRRAWSRTAFALRNLGASVESVSGDVIDPAVIQKSLAAYYVLVSGEASSNLARYDGLRYGISSSSSSSSLGASEDDRRSSSSSTETWSPLERQYAATRTRGFGSEVARRVLCGTSVLSSDRYHTYYEAAAKLRAVLTRQLSRAFDDGRCDVLLVPTAVFPPPSLSKEAGPIGSTEMFANDVMTVPASLAGLPAVSIPVPGTFSADSPLLFSPGMQLIGPRLGESTLLHVARALENSVVEGQYEFPPFP